MAGTRASTKGGRMTTRIGVTGAGGFIGGWVRRRLERDPGCTVATLERDGWERPARLREFVAACDVVVHLAGVNRGAPDEVESVNPLLADRLADACRTAGATPHIVATSSTKRDEDSPYGRGKRRADEVLAAWAEESGGGVSSLVVPNVFGAGCLPFYNSVVATFCHQLARGETPTVVEDRAIELVWVGDLAERVAEAARGEPPRGARVVPIRGGATLRVGELLAILDGFRSDYFERDVVPDLTTSFRARLYTTFVSHVPAEAFVRRPPLHADQRGDLCEAVKTVAGGQVFFSTTRPGVTRGNHYHTRKAERFCVVRGEATIRLRRVGTAEVHEFHVSGDRPEFVTIPVMHAHSIENTGRSELLTLFWTNELFDPADADTHSEDVLATASRVAA